MSPGLDDMTVGHWHNARRHELQAHLSRGKLRGRGETRRLDVLPRRIAAQRRGLLRARQSRGPRLLRPAGPRSTEVRRGRARRTALDRDQHRRAGARRLLDGDPCAPRQAPGALPRFACVDRRRLAPSGSRAVRRADAGGSARRGAGDRVPRPGSNRDRRRLRRAQGVSAAGRAPRTGIDRSALRKPG